MRAETYADLERFHRTGELDSIPVVTADGTGAFLRGIEPYPTGPAFSSPEPTTSTSHSPERKRCTASSPDRQTY